MMKIIFISILLIALSNSLQSETIFVSNDGDYNSIGKAIEASTEGDTLLVSKGTYEESEMLIDKGIVIIGENYPRIKSKDGKKIFTITADSVTITKMELSDLKRSFVEDRAAIDIDGGDYINIIDNKFNNTFFGIYLAKSKGSVINDNVLKSNAVKEMNSANAIHAWYSKDMTIKNNYVSGHRDGLYFEFCDNSVIENNHSKGNLRYGLHFMFSNFNVYKNNTFEENGAGVAVMYSDNIEMVGNKFVNNWGHTSFGLLLKEIKDSKIHNNLFYGNTKAIYGESAIRINIHNNDFIKNGWAMQMMSSSEQDTITYNNFIGNTFNISTNQNARNYNLYEKNYWSDYSGYDLDNDGIGDVPHRPVKFFSQVLGYTPEAIILLRSFFIELLNFIENIVPVLTPDNLKDVKPMVKKIDNDSVPRHI